MGTPAQIPTFSPHNMKWHSAMQEHELTIFIGMITLIELNPLNPIVHFWLHHTAHCAEKMVSVRLHAGSALAKKVGQGEVGGITR